MKTKITALLIGTLLFCAGVFVAIAAEPFNSPVPRTINYDGTLENEGDAVTGDYDFRFQLINDGGLAIWPGSGYAERSLAVNKGKFSVTFPGDSEDELDDEVFNTRPLKLRISVKAGTSETYNMLDQAVEINAVPFAVKAERAVEVDTVPTGMIAPFFGDTAPYGWLIADGRTINKGMNVELSDLVDHLKSVGGDFAGVGSSEAVLPDLRGMFLRGRDTGAGNNPDGEFEIGEKQQDAFQGHFHEAGEARYYKDSDDLWFFNNGSNEGISLGFPSVGNPTDDGQHGTPKTSSETRPKNMTILYIIKW